jgi:ureidoacrylate peracid hydrolase
MTSQYKLLFATIAPAALVVSFAAGVRTGAGQHRGPTDIAPGTIVMAGLAPAGGGMVQAPGGGRQSRQDLPDGPPTVAYKGREIPNTLQEILNPKHTALVIHEMLNTFISEGGGYDRAGRRYDVNRMAKILPPIQKLIATAHAKGVRVAYLRYTSNADGSASSEPQIRGSIARTGSPPAPAGDYGTVDGSWGWQNIDAIKPGPNDWVIRKYRPNGFNGTPLDDLLRWNGIRTFIIVGIGGEVGLLPTTEMADELGYFTIIPSDCVLSSNASRQEALMPFLADHAMMRPSQEIIDSWNKR